MATEIDFDKALTLLHVAEKANQWPTLHHLRDKAMDRLARLGIEELKPEQPKNEEPPKPPKLSGKGDA